MIPEIYFHVIYKSGLVRRVDIPISANALVLAALWAVGQDFKSSARA